MTVRVVTVLSDQDVADLRQADGLRAELATRIAQQIAQRLVVSLEVTMREDEK